ncbi:MAG TPA: cation:proton antiporter [Gaiellales bacterium]|nr:cation:proton antiporter [Gaiellales bacterium]
MSTNDILLGIGLVLALAVGSQLTGRWLGLPAIVVLLPAGFLAGAVTDDVHPDQLMGALFQPFVSLAVGIILFEAGLRLSFDEIAPRVRGPVARLIAVGVSVTLVIVAATVAALFSGLATGVAILIGAILVVSGPTVVLPLLAFIRPAREVRTLLKWEGVLVDPVGALIGVLVFQGVQSGRAGGAVWRPGEFFGGMLVGAAVGAAGAVVLFVLLREVQRSAPAMVISTTLAVVVGSVVVADLLRDDTGFVAATLMGIILGNQHLLPLSRRVDVTAVLGFHEALVQLLIGVMFILIAASVTTDEVRHVLGRSLVLVAVIVLVVRPLAVMLATWRSEFSVRERAFVAWLAPRGIVAGATASAFSLQLEQQGFAGAERILPIVFIVIFATVVLYGLTAPLVARSLGVAGQERGLVLVVGGEAWARQMAAAIQSAGASVRMWVGPSQDRDAARAAGIDAGQGGMLLDSVNREAELEEVTDALLLTRSDDFNALAAGELRRELGHDHVFRVAPDHETADLLPPPNDTMPIGSAELTHSELRERVAAGWRILTRHGASVQPGDIALLAVAADGRVGLHGTSTPVAATVVLSPP